MSKKDKPLAKLVRARGNYVLNQKSFKFFDKRTRRNRDRNSQQRNSIKEFNE
jgi:hypothetical protein